MNVVNLNEETTMNEFILMMDENLQEKLESTVSLANTLGRKVRFFLQEEEFRFIILFTFANEKDRLMYTFQINKFDLSISESVAIQYFNNGTAKFVTKGITNQIEAMDIISDVFIK